MQDSSAIQPFDLYRIFIGDLPWLFTLEIVLRTTIVYVYTLLLVRWFSQRAVGQLSLVEFLLVIALGSAVGDPMFYPDVPLLHGMTVITVVVLINRGIEQLISRNERFERFIEGVPICLVHDGLIEHAALTKLMLNRDELFQSLRVAGIENIGMVRHAYMEQNGQLSVFRFRKGEVRAGLQINPPWDLITPAWFAQGDRLHQTMHLGCVRCGNIHEFAANAVIPTCDNCGYNTWTDRVQEDDATINQ
jgi:uncharacterized membrane protein YcaP (DUF421 family)